MKSPECHSDVLIFVLLDLDVATKTKQKSNDRWTANPSRAQVFFSFSHSFMIWCRCVGGTLLSALELYTLYLGLYLFYRQVTVNRRINIDV